MESPKVVRYPDTVRIRPVPMTPEEVGLWNRFWAQWERVPGPGPAPEFMCLGSLGVGPCEHEVWVRRRTVES